MKLFMCLLLFSQAALAMGSKVKLKCDSSIRNISSAYSRVFKACEELSAKDIQLLEKDSKTRAMEKNKKEIKAYNKECEDLGGQLHVGSSRTDNQTNTNESLDAASSAAVWQVECGALTEFKTVLSCRCN